jgi:hypothetical protein
VASSKQPGFIGARALAPASDAIRALPSSVFPTGYAIPLANYLARRRRKAKPAGGTREITVVGDFPKPWANAREEIAAIKEDLWFPSTDDFIAVERNSRKKKRGPTPIVDSVESFIHLILDQPAGSIKRINIITHGNGSKIAFSGEIDKEGAVFFDEELDVDTLRGMLRHGIEYRGKHVEWNQVARRFARDAEIVVFACKAAINETLLQDVAEYFEVTVRGFTAELHYHVTFTEARGVIHRNEITVDGKKDLDDLTPTVVKKPELFNPFY